MKCWLKIEHLFTWYIVQQILKTKYVKISSILLAITSNWFWIYRWMGFHWSNITMYTYITHIAYMWYFMVLIRLIVRNDSELKRCDKHTSTCHLPQSNHTLHCLFHNLSFSQFANLLRYTEVRFYYTQLILFNWAWISFIQLEKL